MRPFLPPSPTLSFPSFRPKSAPKIPSVSSLPASFNLRRRQPRRIQSLSQLSSTEPSGRTSPSHNHNSSTSAPFKRGHRKSKSSSSSGGSMNALRMANDMLPAGLRLSRRDDASLLPIAGEEREAGLGEDDGDVEAGCEVYDNSDLAIESAVAAIWNSGCLYYLVSPDDTGLEPAPSQLFNLLRLGVLALVLLPLLLSLSSGARCLSARDERLSSEKHAGVWASTVGSGVGIYVWSRYITGGWSLSSPWVAYQALILAIAIVGIVYTSIVRRVRTIEELEDEVLPLEYATPPGSPRAKASSPISPVGTPVRGTPRGSRENLVAMLA